ncbi:MAG: hypothetical protein Q8M26_08950 [Pseudolabrys sp.]|nr:hypothetical protein [Pseudolabrys sp.]
MAEPLRPLLTRDAAEKHLGLIGHEVPEAVLRKSRYLEIPADAPPCLLRRLDALALVDQQALRWRRPAGTQLGNALRLVIGRPLHNPVGKALRQGLARPALLCRTPADRRKVDRRLGPVDLRSRIEVDDRLRPCPGAQFGDGKPEQMFGLDGVEHLRHLIERQCLAPRRARGDAKFFRDAVLPHDDDRRRRHQRGLDLRADRVDAHLDLARVNEGGAHHVEQPGDAAGAVLEFGVQPAGAFKLLRRRPERNRRGDLADVAQMLGEQFDGAHRDVFGCDRCGVVVKVGFEDGDRHDFTRATRSFPRCLRGRCNKRSELDLCGLEICCAKASAACRSSVGVIAAGVPVASMIAMGLIEVVFPDLESGWRGLLAAARHSEPLKYVRSTYSCTCSAVQQGPPWRLGKS